MKMKSTEVITIKKIDVRPYQKQDYEQAMYIAYDLIKTYIEPLAKMNSEKGISFYKDIDQFPQEELEGFFVATIDNEVQGVMMLLFKEQNIMKQDPMSLYKLIRKYGLFKTLMSLAVHKVFSPSIKGDEVYISFISVSEAARGNGLGSKLLGEAEEFTRNHLKRKLTLTVVSNNLKAKKLYERVGFVENGGFKYPLFARKRLKAKSELKMIKEL